MGHDELTGLPSRSLFDQMLATAATAAAANVESLSLLLIDIDHFKKINDVSGHDAGDIVLRELGDPFRKQVRSPSIAARLGGDEFVVVLPRTQLVDAVVEAERLRDAIGQHQFSSSADPVTVSIGVATSPTDRSWNAQYLVEFADLRLVVAKKRMKAGRNRVWAGQLPPSWHDPDARFRSWPTLEVLPDY